jgi:hypothetical protein
MCDTGELEWKGNPLNEMVVVNSIGALIKRVVNIRAITCNTIILEETQCGSRDE